MTTSIKIASPTEAAERVKAILPNIEMNDITIVNFGQHNQTDKEIEVTSSVRLANVNEIQQVIQSKLNRKVEPSDISVVSFGDAVDKSFNVSSSSVSDLKNKLEGLGIDMDLSNVAVITSDQLVDNNATNNNGSKKLKK